jgi:predicted O-methyltransferase YrrM
MSQPWQTLSESWQTVPGWLTPAEGHKLQELAAGRRVVELGSWKGRSTCALLETAALVITVDWHRGDEGAGWDDTYLEFLTHVHQRANPLNLISIRGRIEQVGPLLATACAELVFVDSAHDEAAVARDTTLALRLLAPGGLLVWHDWNYDSVQRGAAAAWTHALLAPASLPPKEQIVGSLAWLIVEPWMQQTQLRRED